MIKGGYYIKARKIMESDIMNQPPHVREAWDYILLKANHKDVILGGKTIKRGQLVTSLDSIRNGLSWYVGFRKEMYTKTQMKTAMKILKEASMITTIKTTRGMIITVCNYDTYQNPRSYEASNDASNESTNEPCHEAAHTPPTINKNELKNKERKKSPKSPKGRVKVNTDTMIRIGSWFKRKPETLWQEKEARILDGVLPTMN